MNYGEFAKKINSDEINSAFLLHGTEEYIKDLAVKTVIEKYVEPGLKDINFGKIDNPDCDIADIEKAMLPLPFMSQKRVVTVCSHSLFNMNAAQLKQAANQNALKEIENIIKRCPKETVLLFIVRGQAASACVKLFSEIEKDVEFKPPSDAQKQKYLIRMAKEEGVLISPTMIKLLEGYTGMELLELNLEMKKLKAYVGQEQVKEQDIYSVCPAAAEYSVFKMLKHISSGEGSHAISEYRRLILAGQSPQSVISMIERQFRALFYMEEIAGQNDAGIKAAASKLKTKDFVVKNMRRTAGRLNRDKIKKIAQWCADADYLIKRGKISVDNSAEMLIIKLINI